MRDHFDWQTSRISLTKSEITPEELNSFFDVLPRKFIEKNRELLKESQFVREKKGIFADKDFGRHFNLTGAGKVSKLEELGVTKDFFTQESGRFFTKSSESATEYLLRGPRYICAIDPNLSVRQKLRILSEDAIDGINFLKTQKLPETGQFKTISPVLDYVKNTAITILNAYIYYEKMGTYRQDDESYNSEKTRLIDLVRKSSFSYYLSLVDSLDQATLETLTHMDMVDTINEASLKLKNDFEKHRFPNDAMMRPETTHPLVMLGSVGMILSTHPEMETVVGIPSGSTEIACVLTEACEQFLHHKGNLVLLSISGHTSKKFKNDNISPLTSLSDVVKAEADKLNGKHVIIIDDNASTGNTIEQARDIIVKFTKPSTIVSTVVEADIIRSEIDKNSKQRQKVAHPLLYDLSSSILPISRSLDPKMDLKEIMEINQLVKYYKDKIKEAKTLSEKIKYEVFIDDLQNPTERVLEEMDPEKKIEKFQGTFLSNFYSVPVILDGVTYPSVEHAYQSAKFDPSVFASLSEEQKGMLAESLKQKGYGQAVEDYSKIFVDPTIPSGITKTVASQLREWGLVHKDWDDSRIEVMINLLIQKFNVPELKERLLSTGETYLMEGNTWEDTLWGVCEGKGKNMLGRVLMNLRSKISANH